VGNQVRPWMFAAAIVRTTVTSRISSFIILFQGYLRSTFVSSISSLVQSDGL
jgi:hypothetical protein